MTRSIFSGMQILLDHHWVKDQAVIVEDQSIKAIIPAEMIKHHLPATKYLFDEQHYLIPGLIDLHIHGAAHHDVMDASPDSLHTISRALVEEGVTGFLATTMTAEPARIERVLEVIASVMLQQQEIDQQEVGAAILGVHLEGPFIAPSKLGAQMGEYVKLPDVKLIREWQTRAAGSIQLVTLAPELVGAVEFIKALIEMDIIAGIGHTYATYDETYAAIAAGATYATHLFNAMRGLHQREPGAVGVLLLEPEVSAELIVDGVHLHPGMVELAWRCKGKDKLLLVTDAMRAKCASGGDGEYELGGQKVKVQAGKATLADGTLAGSVLRLPQAIKNMCQYTHCSLEDAIAMATHNPAQILRLDTRKGRIEIGFDADLVVLNPDLEVKLTMCMGKESYKYKSSSTCTE